MYISLITGFLGAGKTTFIHKFVPYLKKSGYKVGIIENDFGAVNVDRMFLNDLEDDKCVVEQVLAANILDYKRRFKTKLIALRLQGCDYVLVEPSGIYNIDLFFDVLEDDLLHDYYEVKNIITVIDSSFLDSLTKEMKYLIASQIDTCGSILISKIGSDFSLVSTKEKINDIIHEFNVTNSIESKTIAKEFDLLSDDDFHTLANNNYSYSSIPYVNIDLNQIFKSVFFFNLSINLEKFKNTIGEIFLNQNLGIILRIKGYIKVFDKYIEINATKNNVYINESSIGQEALIFIGQNLNKDKIEEVLKSLYL